MPSPTEWMTLTFVVLLLMAFAVRLVLLHRQAKHVARERAQVPTFFQDTIDLAAHQKAADYTLAQVRMSTAESAASAATVLGWTLLGGLDALNQALLALMGPGIGQQLALLVLFALLGAALDAPWAAYRTFVIEERFGFNRTTLGPWLLDGLKGALVALLFGLPLLLAFLWLMDRAGHFGWVGAWSLYMGTNLLALWAFPALIAPWFNRFSPLYDHALRQKAQLLMQRCGFNAEGFYVMDGSRRSAHANAYFTGWGKSKRVVFYDTLLNKLTTDELEAVLAHELGHFHHKHLIKRLITLGFSSLLAFGLMGWLSHQSWFYVGLGVEPSLTGANHGVALALFALFLPLLGVWVSPWASRMSQKDEFEADRYATQQTSAQHLSRALVKLYQANASTLTPDPVYAAFYQSHPPAIQRLARLSL